MNFQQVDQQYTELRRSLDNGSITREAFEGQLQELMIQDGGGWWSKAPDTGAWMFYNGTAWEQRNPPGYQPAVATPPPPNFGPAAQQGGFQQGQGGFQQPNTFQQGQGGFQQPNTNQGFGPGMQPQPGPMINPNQQQGAQIYNQPTGKPIGQGMTIALYVLSFIIPLVGWVLFFMYRNKPFESDRKFAKIAGIIATVAFVLACARLGVQS